MVGGSIRLILHVYLVSDCSILAFSLEQFRRLTNQQTLTIVGRASHPHDLLVATTPTVAFISTYVQARKDAFLFNQFG